jgi:hypothetical protein
MNYWSSHAQQGAPADGLASTSLWQARGWAWSLCRMKVLVFGNSGSGKSTYAQALAAREGLPHLDLDSIVWEPGQIAVQRSPESVEASLRSFVDSHSVWVIEGLLRRTRSSYVRELHAAGFPQSRSGCVPRKQSQAALGATQVRLP